MCFKTGLACKVLNFFRNDFRFLYFLYFEYLKVKIANKRVKAKKAPTADWSQYYKTFFILKHIFLWLFAIKIGRFSVNRIFYLLQSKKA
jgi:hypothetical protein